MLALLRILVSSKYFKLIDQFLFPHCDICRHKSAIVSGVKKDSELAQICSISNPNRIYYLRIEVANTSINALAKAVTMVLDLEMSIKRGSESKDLLLIILSVSRLFQLT